MTESSCWSDAPASVHRPRRLGSRAGAAPPWSAASPAASRQASTRHTTGSSPGSRIRAVALLPRTNSRPNSPTIRLLEEALAPARERHAHAGATRSPRPAPRLRNPTRWIGVAIRTSGVKPIRRPSPQRPHTARAAARDLPPGLGVGGPTGPGRSQVLSAMPTAPPEAAHRAPGSDGPVPAESARR
jgi:hypothetical protein